MKKYFEFFGIFILALFSFYYSNKTATVLKDTDEIMIRLKKVDKVLPQDAYIDGNYITPGISGKVVDLSKSYDAMKRVGSFISDLIVYKKVEPKTSISNIYNKYIKSGNESKNEISLIFKGTNNISTTLKKYNIEPLFYTTDLTKSKYCILEEENFEMLNICSMNKMHTIIPIKVNQTIQIKKNLKPGSIIMLDIDSISIDELEYIIKYIKSKGLDIVSLDKLLEE